MILIAITLIAAIAIAGFVFGLFGSFTSSAQVSANVTACVSSTGICAVTLTNTGSANVTPLGCSVSIGGTNIVGTLAPAATALNAGASGAYTCAPGVAGNSVGSQAVGSFSLSNGAQVPFTGTWS